MRLEFFCPSVKFWKGDKMFFLLAVLSVFAVNNGFASNNSACQAGTLSCDDGKQCVTSEKWCDKEKDCDDESDEAYCKKSSWWTPDPNGCSSAHFLCSSGICVPISARCNDYDDCKEFSDELKCEVDSTTETKLTTKAYKNVEVTAESSEETSEETEESDEDISSEKQEGEDETFVSKPDIILQSSLPTESSLAVSSSTQDYYRKRLGETEASKQEITSRTSSISTRGYRTPTTTASPKVTESHNFFRTTSHYYPRTDPTAHSTARNYYPRQHPTARNYYPHQSQIYDRREQTFERSPYPHYRTSQTYDPQTQDRRPPTYDRQQQTHDRHPPTYDRQQQTHDRHPPTYDRQQQTHDRHPPTYDRRQQTHDRRPPTYDRRQQTHDRRPENYDRSSHVYGRQPQANDRSSYDRRQPPYDTRSQTSDNRASIFSNRIPRPTNTGQVSVDNNVLNGEQDWREVASLKPYSGGTEINKPFHFTKNYAKLFGRGNSRHVRDGEDWLLNQRNEAGDWGKDTARALVALSLTNNSFPSGNSEYELMKRKFLVQLSIALLRNGSKELHVSRMAMALNALFAVCENPRDFHALDLTELLRIRIRETIRNRGYPNPFVYLSLCLSGKPLTDSEVQNLMKKMTPSGTQQEMSMDMQSLAVQAFACYMQQVSTTSDHAYLMSLQEKLNSAVSDLLSRMGDDGSFGSAYSTALAAQALISVNDSRGWNADKTIHFLKQQQREDGSFGDLLATYYALPALSGRSLLHLRNTQCTPAPVARDLTPSEILEFVGPKQFIHYSIYFGYPLVSSHSVRVLVPEGISFLDVMKVAEYQNRNFRFSHETGDKNVNVYSISGTPNDSEQGLSWHLYAKDDSNPNQKELQSSELYSGDLRDFFPTSSKHMVFWYHPIGLRN